VSLNLIEASSYSEKLARSCILQQFYVLSGAYFAAILRGIESFVVKRRGGSRDGRFCQLLGVRWRLVLKEHLLARAAITDEELLEYRTNGYVLVRSMLDEEETSLLGQAARQDRILDQHSFARRDGEGGTVRLSLWNHPTDTIYGMVARSEAIVNSAEKLLDGEVYHYHSKMIMKDAKVGGAWTWHQDYGYWYQNGVLFPLLTSVFIAIDRATRQNGCLQVIRGSHQLGRIEHVLTGDQAGADQDRVDEILKRLDLDYVEMEPGDALYFDPNLLHRSDQNRSADPRWSMICCYNAARNNPYKESHQPRYTPLVKVPNAEIKKAGMKRFADSTTDAEWLDPGKDLSATVLKRNPSST
jgi:ectoine hydroxylase